MVWQEKSVVLIALTKVGGPKCELYFPPERGKAIQAGSVKIQNQQVEHIRDTYDKCVLQISKEGQKRTVVHLLYHAWPDKGTPDSSSAYLNFMETFNEMQRTYTRKLQMEGQWLDTKQGMPPIVVHCSAGVGRTGTLCALDVITERMQKTPETLVSVGQTVRIMRKQRHKAVQRPEQYLFLYLAVVEYAIKHDMIDPTMVDVSSFIQKKQQS